MLRYDVVKEQWMIVSKVAMENGSIKCLQMVKDRWIKGNVNCKVDGNIWAQLQMT